jgi:signal transduction histidine kinase
MQRLFFLIFVLLVTRQVSGQEARLDSLTKKLSSTHASTVRIDLLNELALLQFDYDPSRSLDYVSQALTLAQNSGYARGHALALTLKGYYYYLAGEHTSALRLFRHSATVRDQPGDVRGYNLVLWGDLLTVKASYDSARVNYTDAIALLQAAKSPTYLAQAYRSFAGLQGLRWENDSAEEYFRMAMGIYESQGNLPGKARVYFALSDLAKNRAQYKRSEELMSLGCEIAGKLDDTHLKLNCVVQRGEIQFRMGNYLPALESLLHAVELLNRKDEPLMLTRVYGDLGDVYDVLTQNDVSLRYYFEGLKLAERIGIPREIAANQANIAWVYKNEHKFKLAFEFVEKAIAIRSRIGDESGIASAYNTKGIIYFEQDMFAEAEEWLKKSLAIRNKMNQAEGASICFYNLALVFQEQKLYRKALSFQRSNFALEKNIGNKYNIAGACNNLGGLHTNLQNYDSAIYFLTEGERIGRELKSLALRMDNAFLWSEFYEARNDTRQALKWHKQYALLNDSIYDENSANKLAEMNALYHTDQKDQEIRFLQQERLLQKNELQLQKTRINQQNLIIISVIIGFLLVSVLAFKTYQYNRQARRSHQEITHQKEELESQAGELQEAYKIIEYINKKLEAKVEDKSSALEKAYKELDTFFYRASHDFRRPLTTFLGLAEVANISVKDPNALELFGKVRDTARNLDKMLLKLQSISDMGSQEMTYKEVKIAGIFNDLLDTYREDLESRHISTSMSAILPVPFYSYPTLVHTVIENLFENAINFSRYENGVIRLRAFVESDLIIIEVEDNGEGIGPDISERIFDMYFRGSEQSRGNGLGLYIVRKATEKLKSTISFRSQPGQGATFRIEVPQGHAPDLH